MQAGRLARRQAWFDEVHALRAQGYSHRRIAKTLKLSVNTVRKWLHRDTLPEGRQASGTASKAAVYGDYLQAHWQAGCHSPRQLWLEIRDQGFTGSEASVWRWLLRLRQGKPIGGRPRWPTALGDRHPNLHVECPAGRLGGGPAR